MKNKNQKSLANLKIISIGVIIILITSAAIICDLSTINKKKEIITTTTTSETTTESTSTTTTTTTTIKTTKKKTTTKRKTFNIKASKKEMKDYAYTQVVAKWGEDHWEAFELIVQKESGWNPNSINKSSGACGLFQMYPCSKTNRAYKTDYKAQIDKGISYISDRYKTPNNAWDFWKKHHWY